MLLEESPKEQRALVKSIYDTRVFENLTTNKVATHQKNLLPILSLVLLGGLDQVAVVTALFQLHHNIQETGCATSCPFGKSLVVPGQNPSANLKIMMLLDLKRQRIGGIRRL